MSRFVLIIILFDLAFLQAYRPQGYIGCFKDWRHRILEGKHRVSDTNSGDECIRYCKEDGYRYAGTESEDECYCGNRLRLKVTRTGCTHPCEGNHHEKCGGNWRISVYDILLIKEDTTTSIYTSHITEREMTTRKTITRKLTSKTTTIRQTTERETSIKSTYETTGEGRSNGLTQTIANNTLETTHNPHSGIKGDSSKSITVFVAVPIAIISLLLILLLGFFTRRRQLSKKKNRLEQLSQGTGSIPNIYANIIVSNHELSDNAIEAKLSTDGVYADSYETHVNEGNRRHLKQEIEENEAYNTLTKQNHNCDTTNDPYHHVANLLNDETYSVCFGNQFSNKQRDTNKTYSHIKDTAKQTTSISNYDVGDRDNVYNNLQQKKNLHLETTKSVEEVSDYDSINVTLSNTAKQTNGISNTDFGENVYNTLQLKKNRNLESVKNVQGVSDYDTTTDVLSMKIDNGDYSHTNEVALKHFNGINKSFGDDNVYYNDDEYGSVETVFKK